MTEAVGKAAIAEATDALVAEMHRRYAVIRDFKPLRLGAFNDGYFCTKRV